MDCPNCGVYNPEERTVCWRCDRELPRPRTEKRRRSTGPARRTWLILGIALLVWLLLAWLLPLLLGGLLPTP